IGANSLNPKSVDKLFSLRAEVIPPATDCSGNAGSAHGAPPGVLKKPPPPAVELTDVIVGGPVGFSPWMKLATLGGVGLPEPSALPVKPGMSTFVSKRWRKRPSPPAPVPDVSNTLPENPIQVVKFSPEFVPLFSWKPWALLDTAKVPGSAIVLLVNVTL